MTLDEALQAYYDGMDKLNEAATEAIITETRKKYPDAAYVLVTAILIDSYSEHSIDVFDEDNKNISEGDDWPWDLGEEWTLTVCEGACLPVDTARIDL